MASWLADAPSLVAESLNPLRDPLGAWLRPGPPAAPQGVAAALARAWLPRCAADAPPPWLRPDQRLSFGRALAAVRRHRGALLADGVGTGKTYIGLAVAAALEPGRPVHVLAPATLLPQWRAAAARVGLDILPHSHETLSRGRPPPERPGAVLIDESHRFRTASTRRYAALAPWCHGRRGLLLSATPVVNRLEDLSHQLLLLVRDDALATAGVPCLADLREAGLGALAELVITGEDRSAELPRLRTEDIRIDPQCDAGFERARCELGELRLSADRGIAALLRGVLLSALASSPLALAEALRRYRALLLHARDAAAAGRSVSRQAIRRIVGSDTDQLVLWPLVAEGNESAALALEDLEQVSALEVAVRTSASGPDAKVRALRQVIADGLPTLVFTAATATVRYLRRWLGKGTAWCTGSASGLDSMTAPRESVLDWFRRAALPGDGRLARPAILLATDVASEGVDLPLIQRIVHYDLPWTMVRLEQRGGRALRLGSRHHSVHQIRFLPPPTLEAELRRLAILERKRGLPDRLGLGGARDSPWRLRARLAAQWEGIRPVEGIAALRGTGSGTVAGVRLVRSDGSVSELVRARTPEGWTDAVPAVSAALAGAQGRTRLSAPSAIALHRVLRGLSALTRGWLREARGERLAGRSPVVPVRRAMRRLLGLARQAARNRNREQLEPLARGLRFLRRGHTAGEARLLEGWLELSTADLLAALARLPEEPSAPEVTRVELIGILLVEPRAASLASAHGAPSHRAVRPGRHPDRFDSPDPR